MACHILSHFVNLVLSIHNFFANLLLHINYCYAYLEGLSNEKIKKKVRFCFPLRFFNLKFHMFPKVLIIRLKKLLFENYMDVKLVHY